MRSGNPGPDDDVDPTGVRDLLGRLPDPGGMPPAVAADIEVALRQLGPFQARGADDTDLDLRVVSLAEDDADADESDGGASQAADEDPDTALPDQAAATAPAGAGTPIPLAAMSLAHDGRSEHLDEEILQSWGLVEEDSADEDEDDELSAARRLRQRRVILGSVAATVAALAIGGFVLARDQVGPVAARMPGSSQSSAASPGKGPSVLIGASSRRYTPEGLTAQAQELIESPGPALTTAEPSLGPVATLDGLGGCLATLGEDDADTVIADLATFDGAPATILVVVTAGQRQVYVVGRDCRVGEPALIQPGIPLTR